MDLKKASLALNFLFFLHLQHHQVTRAISRSTTRLASFDPNNDDLSLQTDDGDVIAKNFTEIPVVVNKAVAAGGRGGGGGGGGRGGGGGGGGGGGRGFGGGGRGKGGGGYGGGGIHPIPIYGVGSNHRGHRSSGGREIASGWLGFSILTALVWFFSVSY